MLLQPNTTFDNHYTLICQLGRGGFSEVWLAHDSYMDIDVAIKIYAPGQGMDSNSINEFRREITGVFQLNHPNLLCPKHLGIWENMPYLIMAYCPAGSCLKFVGNISESEIWHLIHDVAAGLAYLHEKDIVHQDIKPDNILIDTEGNYLITDFGISTRARSTLRKSVMSTTNSAGTLAYMGPERFSTQPAPTKASDIWSLGAMLYELLEGVTPFPPDFGGSMLNAGAAIPTINAPVSENLKQTIYKMLSKETWDRPTAATLVEWAKNPSAVEKPSRPTQRKITKPAEQPKQPKQPKSKGWIWIIVTLLLIAGLGAIGVRKYQNNQLEIAIKEQHRQDSIRQVQIQDSIREICRQDSIRVVREKQRNDSIAKVHAAENKRLEQMRRDSIANAQTIEKERLRREAQVEEQKRIEAEKRRIYNGHEYVDLGLSVKWATCNVGARKPEEYGDYFAWGETTTKSTYSWSTYNLCKGSKDTQTKYNTNSEYGRRDNKTMLDASNDVARANLGGSWRLPTDKEWTELRENCMWIWVSQKDKRGYKVTSKTNGNSIFLPVAGYYDGSSLIRGEGRYWSSSLYTHYPSNAWCVYFFSSGGLKRAHYYRYYGYSVRPVCP